MMRITPKNWGDFQHYKDRDPPWIKLHKKLLDDYDFQSLPVASRALAPMLWLLASEDKDGVIKANEVKLAFRFRMSVGELTDALMPLIQADFFSVERDASEMIAPCKPDAMPETEAQEQTQVKAETDIPARKRASKPAVEPEGFAEFWQAYPNSKARPDALKAYRQALAKGADPPAIAAGALRYAQEVRGKEREFIKMAGGWLRDERWKDGETGQVIRPTAFHSPEEQENQRRLKEKFGG